MYFLPILKIDSIVSIKFFIYYKSSLLIYHKREFGLDFSDCKHIVKVDTPILGIFMPKHDVKVVLIECTVVC